MSCIFCIFVAPSILQRIPDKKRFSLFFSFLVSAPTGPHVFVCSFSSRPPVARCRPFRTDVSSFLPIFVVQILSLQHNNTTFIHNIYYSIVKLVCVCACVCVSTSVKERNAHRWLRESLHIIFHQTQVYNFSNQLIS